MEAKPKLEAEGTLEVRKKLAQKKKYDAFCDRWYINVTQPITLPPLYK
jgi:hypothetical protein